ncbi:hypothetical protein BASA50_011371 [Batrachochytrium salamandrivorans]|uniref:Uncharacterized protein n=1 Tax=Batrachochytrium salamandrivorans TaxID=1357716 RepID=A0ABQ8EYW4_9FUNG|nr:hypothetical protein BASA62_006678 [Batrachochytrium salamandrivorans]KAH6574291.1 hypothetical protein BASA62_002513 [Batrachochytrium salamandrivorans]KAH6587429.1 hypothetical protein BASA50_011371 [Batrachochytrium salamandrivorans]
MKFSAFSLIAMFMVTANAVVVPMDSTDDAPGLVKRQNPVPVPSPTDDPKPRPTDDPTPVVRNEPTSVVTDIPAPVPNNSS